MTVPAEKPKKTRHLGLKLLAAGVGGFALLILVSFLWIQSVADRKWKELEERVATLEAEARAREGERPVLRGTPIPGNAWDEYAPALKEAEKIPDPETLSAWLDDAIAPDRTQWAKLVAAHPKILTHLAQGAHRSKGFLSVDWSKPFEDSIDDVTHSATVTRFALLKARLLAHEGRMSKALDFLLDALQFSRDYEENQLVIDAVIGRVFSHLALEELRMYLESNAFSREDLTRLDKALRILEDDYPRYPDLLKNELLHMGQICLTHPSLDGPGIERVPFWPRWRFAFSHRLIMTDALEIERRLYGEITQAWSRPWPELKERLAELRIERKGLPNPLLSHSMADQDHIIPTLLSHRACLLLLRAATGFRLTGEVPKLEDPFGTTLKYQKTPDKIRIWSVGRNGKNDGGKGTWGNNQDDPDIVLELEVNE